MSNVGWFKYEWVWQKTTSTGFVHAKNKPLKSHENILVFSGGTTVHATQSADRMPYYPQGLTTINQIKRRTHKEITDTCFAARKSHKAEYVRTESNYPWSVIEFSIDRLGVHPTAKPVALVEYLVRTYTREGETVLDNCMGSGTAGVACVNTGRNFIGIEKDPDYFAIAGKRIAGAATAHAQPQLSFA
jgi:site-specific DNA-methyltransferase (adenine-specific)